jgi:hypothetical protein
VEPINHGARENFGDTESTGEKDLKCIEDKEDET